MDPIKSQQNLQGNIYEFLVEFVNANGIPPTVREICAALGIRSTSTAHMYLKRLEEIGLIHISPNKQRAITVSQKDGARTADVPLVGKVAAGVPILAVENIEDEIRLPQQLLRGAKKGEAFLLRIEGSSMIEIGMLEGDFIIVHSGLQINNGDIVVARAHGEGITVKRFFREKNRIRLQPENADMPPILAAPGDIEIIGRVIGLLRGY